MIEDTSTPITQGGPRKISPFFVPGSIINMIAGLVSIHTGTKARIWATVSACSTANHSMGEAARIIEYGDADIMVAGGAECDGQSAGRWRVLRGARLVASQRRSRVGKPSVGRRSRRLRAGRGRGHPRAGRTEHAKARGARIYCELAGYGMSADALPHHRAAGRRRRCRAQHGQRFAATPA